MDPRMLLKTCFLDSFILLFYVYGSYACMYLCLPGTLRGHKRASRVSGAGVTSGCELSCGCWELNLVLYAGTTSVPNH